MKTGFTTILSWTIAAVGILSSPFVAHADLLSAGGFQEAAAVYDFNFPYNSSVNSAYIGAFPASNVLTASIGGSSVTESYSFTGSTLEIQVNQQIAASVYSYAEQTGYVNFTPNSDVSFEFSNTWNDDGGAILSFLSVSVADLTLHTEVFHDLHVRNDTFIYEDHAGAHSGILLAGHVYQLFTLNYILNYGNIGAGKASGEFKLSTSTPSVGSLTAAVPEPSSFALAGLGGLGLVVGAFRRRREHNCAN